MTIHYLNLNKELKDRFDIEKFFSFDNFTHDPITSYFIEKLSTLPVRGRRTITIEVGRPDILSYKIYNDVQYWWLLLEYNNILKFTNLKIGLEIKYFSIDELEELYYTLKTSELNSLTNAVINDNASVNDNTDIILPDIPSDSIDLNYVYNVNNLDVITINHNMGKMPVPTFVTLDNNGNLVSEDIMFRYTAGLETRQIVILLHTPKTGKVILN